MHNGRLHYDCVVDEEDTKQRWCASEIHQNRSMISRENCVPDIGMFFAKTLL